ncbi:hypothetical protein [Neobacillus sp. BF23-41]|uniref:hypothetical protein n=1 Tax=Neobacillus sp. BF23-41 TaxID=3240280 RepID=UPI0034E3D635
MFFYDITFMQERKVSLEIKTVFKRKDEGLVKVAMRGTTPVKHVLVEDHFWKKYKQIVANGVIPLSMESIK